MDMMFLPAGHACQAAREGVLRADRARESSTAAVAASRAAPSAIKVICQPGMPPVVTTRTVVAGTRATRVDTYPAPGSGSILAKAAGTMATEASRPLVTAARMAAKRRRRAPAWRAVILGRVP